MPDGGAISICVGFKPCATYEVVVRPHIFRSLEILSLKERKCSDSRFDSRNWLAHIYEILYPFLDDCWCRRESRHELTNNLVDEFVMTENLLVLHDTDDAGLK